MFRRTLWVLVVTLLLTTLACGGGGTEGPPAGDDPTNPTPEPPKDGFGSISGDCGLIDAAMLDSASPALLSSALDFGTDPYDAGDYGQLSPGGQKILDDGAAGSSLLSEVFAYEVLYRCDDAVLLKTGDEILYVNIGGKRTDILVSIDGRRVGVSVTRAVGFPPGDPYTLQQAQDLLQGKLNDIAGSSANVAPADAWTKQVLCLVAYSPQHADVLETAYATLDASVQGDTIVQIIVTNGDDDFLY